MDADRLAKLTEAQRACLRRVYRHMTSKDIARELGLSPHTVDQRLRLAIKTLGVANRVDAARLLAEAEDGRAEPYQALRYQPSAVAPPAAAATLAASAAGDERARGREQIGLVRERQLAYDAYVPASPQALPLPFPLRRGEENTLSGWQRIGWVIAIALLSAIAFGALLSGLEALNALL